MASLLLGACSPAVFGQPQEIHRAVLQRDQMTAEFAAQLQGAPHRLELEVLHARQLGEAQVPLSGDPGLAQQLLPYQRGAMERGRMVLRFAPPVVRRPVPDTDSAIREPLALPGRPRGGVDPVTTERLER